MNFLEEYLKSLLIVFFLALPTQSVNFINLRFLKEPQDSALSDNGLTLPCLVNRNDGSYSWLFRSQRDQRKREISSSSHSNGSLIIKNNKQALGLYRCQVSIPGYGRIVSREAEVKKAELSVVSIPDSDSGQGSYFENDIVLLNCKVKSWPQKFSIKWFKVTSNGRSPVSCDPNSFDYICHNEGQSLEIRHLYGNLFGKYFCEVTSSNNEKVSGDHLVVNFIPTGDASTDRASALKLVANIQESHMWVLLGRSITLICGANGQLSDRSGPTITWKHIGKDVVESNRVKIVGRSSLKISAISQADEGLYVCQISLGHEIRTVELSVSVGQPPSFIQKPQNLRGQFQQRLVLPCRVTGNPQPLIEWRKNGELLTSSDDIFQESTGDLNIVAFLTADVGMFQCLARNNFGSIQAAAQILEENSSNKDDSNNSKPGTGSSNVKPPRELKAGVRDTWLSLIWKAPQSEYVDSFYIIKVSKKGSNRIKTQNTTSLGLIIDNLLPETNYTIEVFTRLNDGTQSHPVMKKVRTRKTREEFPKLRNVRAEIAEFGELRISWEHSNKGYKHLTRYRVGLLNLSEDESLRQKHMLELTLPPNTKSVLVSNLIPDAFYRIIIHGENEDGFSQGIVQSSPRVPCKPPSGPPLDVRVDSPNSRSFKVTWSPPPRETWNGQIITYFINVTSKTSKMMIKSKPLTVSEPNTNFLLKDLLPSTIYRISVAAATRAGTGPFSNPIEVKTTDGGTMLPQKSSNQRGSTGKSSNVGVIPAKVTNFKAEPFSHSIVLTWDTPNGDATITHYKISWGFNHPDEKKELLDSSKTKFTIKGLPTNQICFVRIVAVNDNGEGEEITQPVNTLDRAENAALGIPLNLEVSNIGSTQAVLTWKEPVGAYPSYHSYQVRCALVRADQDSPIVKNVTTTKTLITGLLPANRYEVGVRSIDPNKPKSLWSPLSLLVNFDTQGEKPGSAPQDLTVSSANRQGASLQISWQPPEFPNGRITYYIIEFLKWNGPSDKKSPNLLTNQDVRRGDEQSVQSRGDNSEYNWSKRKVAGESLNIVINLEHSACYLFRIYCANSYGSGPKSTIKIYKMPDVNGQNGGPVLLSLEIMEASEMPTGKLIPSKDPSWKPGVLTQYSEGNWIEDNTWWAIIGGVFGAAMLLISITLMAHFCFCRRVSQHNSYGSSVNNRKLTNHHGKGDASENGKVTPLLNKPDLFIHTEAQQYEMERRNSDSVGHHSEPDNDSNHFTSVSQRQFSSDCPGGFSPGSSSGGGINMTSPFTGQMQGPHQSIPAPFFPAGGATGAPMMQANQQHMLMTALQQQQRMGSMGQPIKPKSMLLPQMDPMMHNPDVGLSGGFHQMGSMGRGMMMLQHPAAQMQPPPLRPPMAQMRVGGAPPPRVNASELASHTSSEDIRPLMQASSLSEGSKNGAPVTGVQSNSGAPSRRGSSHVKRKPPSNSTPTSQPKHSAGSGAPTPTSSQRNRQERGDASATSSEAELQKGFSAEELCQEMLNLEGLMKDLNAITQKEFEC